MGMIPSVLLLAIYVAHGLCQSIKTNRNEGR